MLKWSKHRGQKNSGKTTKESTAIQHDADSITKKHKDTNFTRNEVESSEPRLSKNMVEQESALAEARRRFSAQISTNSSLVASQNISSDLPEIRVDSFDVRRRPTSLNYQSPYTSQTSDNCSIASSISLSPTGNSKTNTIERTPKSSRISVPEGPDSNSSTLERGGAKRALDTDTIHIVPKNKINESVVKKAPMKILNQPFETTFRLQVRLPRNQLAVLRVSPKTTIAEVLKQVCYDKGLDIKKYDVRHPENYDEQLRPECSLSDYRLAEVAVCSVNSKGMLSSSNASMSSRSVSTSDILRLQQQNQSNTNLSNPSIIDHSGSGRRVGNTRLSAGDSSMSSGSLGDRRSDSPDLRSLSPGGNYVERPRQGVSSFMAAASVVSAASNLKSTKKRRAPPPPSINSKGNGSQQSLNSISVSSDARRSGTNVPNTLEREPNKRRELPTPSISDDPSLRVPTSSVIGRSPQTKSMSMTNLSSAPSGSLPALQRIAKHSGGGQADNSDNMSVLSAATSIGSIGSINSVGASKKRRAPLAPPSHQKRPLPTNIIPEETPSLLRTEEEVSKDVAKVDEVFSYLRSQSEGRETKSVAKDSNEDANEMNILKAHDYSPSSAKLDKRNGLSREERAGSITISDVVVDSSKDYDSLEPDDDGNVESSIINDSKRLQSKPSPSPSPRKSLKDEDEICQEEEQKQKTIEQTSPVAKIRQFIGLEPNSNTNVKSNVANEELREEEINENGSALHSTTSSTHQSQNSSEDNCVRSSGITTHSINTSQEFTNDLSCSMIDSEKLSKPKKHFVKYNKKAPLTKPLFDPEPSDEPLDNRINKDIFSTNENKSDKAVLSDEMSEQKVNSDSLKYKRKRFSRKLTPTPDAMLIGQSLDSSSTTISVEKDLHDKIIPQTIFNDDENQNRLLVVPDQFSSPATENFPMDQIPGNDKNASRVVDIEEVELRLKPPQKPPRTFDSLILGSSQSFESLSNLDTNSNEIEKSLTSEANDQNNCDNILKTAKNSFSEKTRDNESSQDEEKQGKHNDQIGFNVQTNSDSPKSKSNSTNNDKNKLCATSGERLGNHSAFIYDESSSVETSNLGSSQNIVLGEYNTKSTNDFGDGSMSFEHNTNSNTKSSGSSHIVHGNNEIVNVSQKKDKKHKKHKKEKKNKRKEKDEKKNKIEQQKEEPESERESVLSKANDNQNGDINSKAHKKSDGGTIDTLEDKKRKKIRTQEIVAAGTDSSPTEKVKAKQTKSPIDDCDEEFNTIIHQNNNVQITCEKVNEDNGRDVERTKILSIDNIKEEDHRKNFDMDEHLSDNIHHQANANNDLLSNNQIHEPNKVVVNESLGEEHEEQSFQMSPSSERPIKYQTETEPNTSQKYVPSTPEEAQQESILTIKKTTLNSNDEQHRNLRRDRNRQAISDALEDSFAVIDFSEEDYPDSLVDSELNRSDDISVHKRISDKHINESNINDNQSHGQIAPYSDKIEETKSDDTTTVSPSEFQINVNERHHILEYNETNKVNDPNVPTLRDGSVNLSDTRDVIDYSVANDLNDYKVNGIRIDTENTAVGELEEAPTSLLLTDPPSGFKDSLTETGPKESKQSPTLNEDVSFNDLQNKYSDVVSLGSDSFDQAINKIDAAQELADEDLESNSCNSLPPNLSQIKLVSSNLIDCNLETTSETIMPASTSFKSPARPMSFSIAGYTERSTKETSYTEKLKVGRSDSSGSSSDSSIRSKQPESLLVLHGAVISSGNEERKSSVADKIQNLQNTASASNTMERHRSSTPNNTMNSLNFNDSTKHFSRPNVPINSANSTLEKPPKLYVHRNVELLQEKGISENMTGRNRQYPSVEDERKENLSPTIEIVKTAQNSCDSEMEEEIIPQAKNAMSVQRLKEPTQISCSTEEEVDKFVRSNLISSPEIFETNNPPPPVIPERTAASNLNQYKDYNHPFVQKLKRVSSPSAAGMGPNPWNVRKTSYQSERIVPNEDLALSRARAAGARNISPRRALSPPSSNNKNGLTTTKNNIMTQSPNNSTSPTSNTSLSACSQISNNQEDVKNKGINIIYSHTPSTNSLELISGDNKTNTKTKGMVRSYGADGSLLHGSDGDNNRKETENALIAKNVNVSATPSLQVNQSVPEIKIKADDTRSSCNSTNVAKLDEDDFESELRKPPARREIGEVKRVADQLRRISRPEEEILLHPKPRSPTPPRSLDLEDRTSLSEPHRSSGIAPSFKNTTLEKSKRGQNKEIDEDEDTRTCFDSVIKQQEDKCESKDLTLDQEEDRDMLLRSPHGVVAVDPRHGPPMAVVYAGPPSIQMATWGDRNGAPRSGRARSAHGQAQKLAANGPSHNMRSASAGGPAYIGQGGPPIPPLPVGYTSMHYNPSMVTPGQPSMVLVPQPYHPSHGSGGPAQIIHAPYQHQAQLQQHHHPHGGKHHQHHMVEQLIPEGKNLVPQPPTRNTNNIPKSNNNERNSSSSRYHSLQYDAAENSHQSKSDRKGNSGSKHGILKETSYANKDNNGIRQQSVSSNSKYSSSSSSSRDHSGHSYSNNMEENRISKYNKALNESPAMSQIEKINRERDSIVAASGHHGKKYGNGVVSKGNHSGDSSKSKDSKHKIPEEGVKGRTKSSTINEETLADPALDALAASRRPSAFNNSNKGETDSKSSRSKADKHVSSKVASDKKSNVASNMTSVASKVSPPAMSPSRPQQTFYFGQVQEKVKDESADRKPSAVDKVRRNEALSHPKRSTDQSLNIPVDKVGNHSGHQLSVITVTDPSHEARNDDIKRANASSNQLRPGSDNGNISSQLHQRDHQKKSSVSPTSLSSAISSLSSPSTNSSSSSTSSIENASSHRSNNCDKLKGSNSGSKMINTSYEDNFTFLRRQQQQAAEHNRERLRASPAAQSNSSQHHHASATSLSSEESAFLVPRPKPSSPKEVSASDADDNASKSSQPIKNISKFTRDEPSPKPMKYQANSALNKFKAAENTGNGLLHVAPKQGPSVSPSLMKRQQSSDEVRKAFEAELMAGKQRLKKLGGDSKKTNGENDFYHAPTGGVAVMPTVTTIVRGNGREEGEIDSGLSQVRPPPPPVPPPMASKITGAGKIPEAPKLPGKQGPPAQKITNFPKALISKSAGSKTQNPPQLPAMSAREELMMAIRNRGGVQGLRKTNNSKAYDS